jgi:acetyl esterase/lipase
MRQWLSLVVAVNCLVVVILQGQTPVFRSDLQLQMNLAYQGDGSNRWERADIAIPMPQAKETGAFPLVIEVHGGGWNQGRKDYLRWNKGVRWTVKNRFVYARINYRLSQEAPFPAALHDVMNAVRYFRKHADIYQIDPERIGLQGTSAGGHLSVLAGYAAEHGLYEDASLYPGVSAKVQAVAGLAGVYDMGTLPNDLDNVVVPFMGGVEGMTLERLAEASPISLASADVPPTLLLHSTGDPVVPITQAERMFASLTEAGATVHFFPVDSDEHEVPNPPAHWEMVKWFREHLGEAD